MSQPPNPISDRSPISGRSSITGHSRVKVGDWNVSSDTCTVATLIDGEHCEHKVTPRSMDVLRLLIARAGAVVSPGEFLETIWRSPIATDHAVHKAIAELRSALRDSAHKPRYIKTIPKRGYALIAPIERLSEPTSTQCTAAHPADNTHSSASGSQPDADRWHDSWRRWPDLKAVRGGHLYNIPPDLVQRHSLRALQGLQQMCQVLDQARPR